MYAKGGGRGALMEGGNEIGWEGANGHSYTFGMNQRKWEMQKGGVK